MNKISLSSTFIYEFDIDTSIVDRYLEKFLDCKNVKEYHGYNNDKIKNTSVALSATDEQNNVINFYDKDMLDYVQLCLDEVSDLYVNFKVVICDTWVTRTKFGQIGNWHTHSNSMFSGVVYLTDHNDGHTEFEIRDPLQNKLTPWISQDIIKNINYITRYKPQRGKMLIWPSSLVHRISLSRDKNTRYTLSFNSWPSGQIYTEVSGRLNIGIKL